jgi:hypothetical protein
MGRISALTELTSLASDDYLVVLDSSANIAKKITIANAFGIPSVGWTASGESWTYATATTITVPTDATTKYDEGMIVQFTQATGGVKYAVITTVAATVLTLRMLGGATLVNEAITSTFYSTVASPLGAGLINGKRLDFSFTGEGGIWWEELGRTVLGSSNDNITVSNLPDRKYLLILTSLLATGGTINSSFRFNSDTGSNYSARSSANGGADGTAGSVAFLGFAATASANPKFASAYVFNVAAQEKLIYVNTIERGTAGAANIADRAEAVGKWVNTSNPISSVTVFNQSGTGDYAAGSEVIVLGHN